MCLESIQDSRILFEHYELSFSVFQLFFKLELPDWGRRGSVAPEREPQVAKGRSKRWNIRLDFWYSMMLQNCVYGCAHGERLSDRSDGKLS